jgi:hypothetical protein
MQHSNRWMVLVVVLIISALPLAACGQTSATTSNKIQPAKVEKIEGTELNRVVLTEKAAQRLAIQTAPVREEQVNGVQRKVIPYGALVYGLKGETWAYASPGPLTFVRQVIKVDYIDGDRVVLADGPAAGTMIVTVGVPELYGADTGIGK